MIGSKVECGFVNMSRYKLDGGFERRWFTGMRGEVIKKVEGCFPDTYEILLENGKTIHLEYDAIKKC